MGGQNSGEARETLCFQCARATGGCSWSDELRPVRGWFARRGTVNGKPYSYSVFRCPEYRAEQRGNRNPDTLDTDGCEALLRALLRQTVTEYRETRYTRDTLEEWFRSEGFAVLYGGIDPEWIIRKCKEGMK